MNINLLYSDISPDFGKSWDNDVQATKGARAVKNSIMGIVSTRKGSRPFNPDFGCDITNALFDNMTPLTEETVRTNVLSAIRNYEPRVYNVSVDAVADYDNNQLLVTITFSIIDNPDVLEQIKLRLSK